MSVVPLFVVVCLLLLSSAFADVYLHNPRGNNNRLNERGQNRDNANRLFDSQNNDKGGYAWGPPMHYYVGSQLHVEWTNQHACNNPKTYCELVLQYMCAPDVRDGTVTTTIPDNADGANEKVSPDPLTGENTEVFKYGMNENYIYYQNCKTRERNRGLFIADQNVGPKAINTRQNPNGQRHGFECPEERDYYPYWHPSPWKDVAILVGDTSRCDYYRKESQNVKGKNYCTNPAYNNQRNCTQNGGEWKTQKSWGIDAPECLEGPWTRDNHNGNTLDGYAPTYNWTIPDDVNKKCVFRLRYNISTHDYEPWKVPFANASWNGNKSPVRQDPTVNYFGNNYTLAINTAQFGRTFEDRSYTFEIRDRPMTMSPFTPIHNLNVRGKRGNIVQVYPAVEYDYVPERLNAKVGDYIHLQWTGSDFNPQNNDGEGRAGTDRSNVVQISCMNRNYPYYKPEDPMFDSSWLQSHVAFLNQTNCDPDTNDQQNVRNCKKLNAASPYFNAGLIRLNRTGTWFYMCSRNNNFSNRSQKGALFVTPLVPTWSIFAVAGATAVFVLGAIVAGVILFAKANPANPISAAILKLGI